MSDKVGPLQRQVVALYREYGPMAPWEACAKFSEPAGKWKRISELKTMGLLKETGEARRNPLTGRHGAVLEAVI